MNDRERPIDARDEDARDERASANDEVDKLEDEFSDDLDAEERQWAMFAHLGGLAGFIIPFGNLIVPLVIWQMKKEEMPFVDEQGREALNFQITVAIAVMACLLLMVILIGLLLLPLVALGALVFTLIAAIKANDGEHYRYPFTLRLIN